MTMLRFVTDTRRLSDIAHDETPAHLIGSGDRAAWLLAGYCPDSGERLVRVEDDGYRPSLMCDMCDCFGYDPEDPTVGGGV